MTALPIRRLLVTIPLAALACASVIAPPALGAQRLTADSGAASASRASRRFLVRGTIIAAATLATMPFDVRLAEEMRDGPLQRNGSLRDMAKAFDAAGDPGVLVASAAMFAAGRVARAPGLTRTGLHAGEAVVIAGATTSLLKAVAGRQRPYVAAGDADDFTPFRVAGGHTAFPSGHTTVAFAFASAVTAELATSSSRAAWIGGPLLYGGATLVGVARMYDDKHWASDVVLGAGIGTLAGIETVAFSRVHPHNRIERLLGTVTVVPARQGIMLAVSQGRS
ncbi:MAG: phosphatase PAP2 family protein [Gemmatimonadaceae bacterium]